MALFFFCAWRNPESGAFSIKATNAMVNQSIREARSNGFNEYVGRGFCAGHTEPDTLTGYVCARDKQQAERKVAARLKDGRLLQILTLKSSGYV